MKTIRLSLLLLIVALLAVMSIETQQSATSARAIRWCCYEESALWEKYLPFPAVRIRDPRNIFKASQPQDKSVLWKIHLAMQLVNHPELNKEQVQVILSAISLSTTEFFATSNRTPANKAKADEALESLTRRAVRAFGNDQTAQVFANVPAAEPEQDVLKMYRDLSALSLRKRRAAFRNAEPNDKSKLWRTHLALFFLKRELSDRQKEVTWSAMSLATPDYFRVRSTDPDWEANVRQPTYWLEKQIFDAFSLNDAAKMFATLGDDGESARNTAGVLLKNISYKPFKQWAHTRISLQDMLIDRDNCSCSTQSDYCPLWGGCNSSNCSPTQDGCGTLWSYPCTGVCR